MSVSSASGIGSGISLREILPQATFLNTKDVLVRSCCGALEECQPNDLFVALLQSDGDGHEDAASALQRGATAVLTERLLPISAAQCIVEDSRIAYGQVCQALAGYPSRRLKTVAVGGTDGKTTVAHLIGSILKAAGQATGLHTSLSDHTPLKAKRQGDGTSTFHPPGVAGTLAQMVQAGYQWGVLETPSVPLAQHCYAGLDLDVAVITNLRGNHFGFHSTLSNYCRAQLRLLDYLNPNGVAVVNADDPSTHFQLDQLGSPTLTIGIKQLADVRGKVIACDLQGTQFTISAGTDTVLVSTRLAGLHQVYNCLAAAATALLQGIDLPTIATGLENVDALPGRMNSVRCGQPFPVVVDEAASPYRLGVALNTLKRNTAGKVYCVFSVPSSADQHTAGQFGRIAERNCHVPVITRPLMNHRSSLKPRTDYEPIHQVLDGFRRVARARVMPDRIAAIEWALSQATSGDAVLIAGGGEKSIGQMSGGRWQLTDTDVCQSWLYGETRPAAGTSVAFTPNIFPISNYRPC